MAGSFFRRAAHRVLPTLRSDQLVTWLTQVQAWRGTLEDLEGAALHLWALPSRADLRRLQRRVVGLRRRVSELDRLVARLERAVEDSAAPAPPEPGPKEPDRGTD